MKKGVKGNDLLRFRGLLTFWKLLLHRVRDKANGTERLVSDRMEQ